VIQYNSNSQCKLLSKETISMSEFKCTKKAEPANWRVFHHALSIISEILKETDFNPSAKQEATILGLLSSNVNEIYTRTIPGNNFN